MTILFQTNVQLHGFDWVGAARKRLHHIHTNERHLLRTAAATTTKTGETQQMRTRSGPNSGSGLPNGCKHRGKEKVLCRKELRLASIRKGNMAVILNAWYETPPPQLQVRLGKFLVQSLSSYFFSVKDAFSQTFYSVRFSVGLISSSADKSKELIQFAMYFRMVDL